MSGTSLAYAAMLKPLSVLLCALALVLAACGGDDDWAQLGGQDARRRGAAQAEQHRAAARTSSSPPPRDGGGQKKPQKPLDPAKTYEVDARRPAAASFTIRLDQKTSPNAAASFAALARNGFFDDTIFHRIVPGLRDPGRRPDRRAAPAAPATRRG